MVERNTQIDLVIPFYNDSDKEWANVLYEYMKKEGSNDRQVVGEERYRDWDNFKYWFRGVEQNCKWVNKVFLIVASESQVPKWLDTSYEKLRVVYHKEFIPKELLPTFNIMTIELFIPLIKDLSNNYIWSNDDYFFLNSINEDMFFRNNLPVYSDTQTELKKLDASGVDGTFYQALNNGMDLQLKLCNNPHWYAIDHLFVAHKKDFEKEIIEKYYDDFIKANLTSRFRSRDNLTNHVYLCLYKDTMPYIKYNNCQNSCYVSVVKDTNFNDFKDKQMVCFNDTQRLEQKDFYEVKKRMLDFMESKFPNKSSYEKGGNMVKLETTYEFTLKRFNELRNIIRKDANKHEEGWLYLGDTFECEQELANYLTGNNPNKTIVAKVIEVIPNEWKKDNEPLSKEECIELDKKVEEVKKVVKDLIKKDEIKKNKRTKKSKQ